MGLVKDFWIGIVAYFKAFQFVFDRGMWWYFLIPIAISVGLYFGGDLTFDYFKDNSFLDSIKNKDFSDLRTDAESYNFLLLGIQSLIIYIVLKLNKYVVLIAMTPILTGLSAKTERLLTENRYPFSVKQFFRDIERAIRINIRNMLHQMVWIVLWYIAAFSYPPLQVGTPIYLFVIGFFYYGFSLLDYSMERQRLNVEESVKLVRKHGLLAFSLGGMFSLIWTIPYAGAVFAPILGVIAATIALHERIDLSKDHTKK